MQLKVQVPVKAAKEQIWKAVTDIDNAPKRVSGIEKVEVLERPANNELVGLKWRETRTMFGKTATEVMWITEATPNSHYKTRAESHGSVYESTIAVSEEGANTYLSMEFGATPQTFGAKLLWALTGFMFKGATKKALLQDLNDIKASVEDKTAPAEG